jgi:hypothetical protein
VLTAFAICFMAKFVPPFAAMGLLVALVEASVPLALASVVACGYPPAVELAGVTSLLRPRHLPRARTDPGELSSPLRDPRLDGHGEDRWRSLAGVLPRDVTAYCPTHEWAHFTRDVAGPSGTATSPLRTPSPMVVSPVRSPSPPGARGGRVASPTPPDFERQGTIAARCGAPPLDINNAAFGNAAPLHPPPPPLAWLPVRRNATTAANRHPASSRRDTAISPTGSAVSPTGTG